MVASKLDLNNELAVEIGANYDLTIQLCGCDDLTLYQGICNVKSDLLATTILFSPTIEIVNKDTFKLLINFGSIPLNLLNSTAIYDVLFFNLLSRFFAVEGKMQLIKRVTTVI